VAEETIGQRFLAAFGRRDLEAMKACLDEEVVLYTPLTWGAKGVQAFLDYTEEFHRGFPGLRVALHDEFYAADGHRGAWRMVVHYENTGPFFGNAPTGDRGTQVETHTVTIQDGRIVEYWVGDNSFHMPHLDLVRWRLDWPRQTPDPNPEQAAWSASEAG
jgi:ketosteroid isomerase-like protein